MYDWENLPPERKIEVLGFIYFNRSGEEDWLDYNSLYDESENFYTITSDEEE